MITTVPLPAELNPPNPPHDPDWPGYSGPACLSPTATPTTAPLHGHVLRQESAGDPAYHRRDQSVCKPPSERPTLPSRAAGADEPQLVDLLRLHTPTPDAVIVRVSGTVDRRGAQLLAELARKQLNRAPHLIIDLGDVSELTRTLRIRLGIQRDRQSAAEVGL